MPVNDNLPPIYFYLPQEDWREDMPDRADVYWPGFSRGIYCWTLQTYLHLKADGFPCRLVGTLPDAGIVLSHRESFKYELKPTSKVLMVCMKADQEAHPYAQFHVVQNLQETKVLKNSYYMPHWCQPGLVPRDADRGDRFENICYFGISYNLAPELKDPSWSQTLQQLGLHWQVVDRSRWHDYSDVDAIVAVRNFGQSQDYGWKPATKLYNAWHAGVPAILGRESAFQAERQGELDYIEVTSLGEAITALKRLQEQPQLRRAMIENGRDRAQKTPIDSILAQWHSFLIDVAVPAYDRWCNAPSWSQQLFLQRCYLAIKVKGLTRRMRSLFLHTE